MTGLLPREGGNRIFDRRCRVTVDGLAVEALRVGFTIEKDLKPTPNTAEIAIYNLDRRTRDKFHHHKAVPVVVEAGYAQTGMSILFVGEMREAFSRPEADGTWATILRAGDGDGSLRGARSRTGLRPGISVERVIGDQFKELAVGMGNAYTELKQQIAKRDVDVARLGEALAKGFTGGGSAADAAKRAAEAAGLEYSVQDGQLQVLKKGQVLATRATVLAPETGLEGSPEIDAQGTMHCRARILPGLFPGYPLQVTRYSRADLAHFAATGVGVLDDDTVYRIEKTRFVGDNFGDDWGAELDCRDVKLGPKAKKKVRR